MAANYFPLTEEVIARFWNRVDKNGPKAYKGLGNCWLWKCSRSWGWMSKKYSRGPSRLAYRIQKGEIKPGMLVLHRCDNGACVRGFHLYQGTPARNMQDMLDRGRDNYWLRRKGKYSSDLYRKYGCVKSKTIRGVFQRSRFQFRNNT